MAACACTSSSPQASAFLSTISVARKAAMACSSLRMPPPPPTSPATSSLHKLKVPIFSDERRGIVCYRVIDTGEIICEGFDEGPYFDPTGSSQQPNRTWQPLNLPIDTRSDCQLKTQWNETLQMLIFEGFDEG